MNYKIVNENDKFVVFEVPTEQPIRAFKNKADAKHFLKHLNYGGAFDGWTPDFFLKKLRPVRPSV